ncbi:MAG: monovalent cation/H+ antiporter subunit D family protein [Myxococcota bacterium]
MSTESTGGLASQLIHHLPVLQIIVPLIAAPTLVFLGKRLAWIFSTAVSFISLAISIGLLSLATAGEPIYYKLGGWAAPVGIVYKVDLANSLMLLIVSMVAAVVMVYARQSVAHEIPRDRHHFFYSALLLCMTGLMGIAITGDAFNVFVFLEISSLSAYALIAMGRSPRALTAAYRYLVIGTIGGTFILLGIGMLYMMTGTLNMEDLAARIPAVAEKSTVRAAFAFMTVGSLIKLALVPLHFWLPNCYTYAPSVVSAFLSATATKISFYVLLRIIFTIFGVSLLAQTMKMEALLMFLSLVAIVGCSMVAIYQSNVKRLLAYSSLAQIGYFVLGLSLNNETALTGSLIHLFNHALMKGGLFMVMGCVAYRLGGTRMQDMAGLGKRMPFTMFAFVLGGLGMIGVPLTAGFVSKWYLVLGAIEAGYWWVGGVLLGASLLALSYIWRVVEVAYFHDPPDDRRQEAPLGMLIPTWAMIIASIVFGIWTSPMLYISSQAAQNLLEGLR